MKNTFHPLVQPLRVPQEAEADEAAEQGAAAAEAAQGRRQTKRQTRLETKQHPEACWALGNICRRRVGGRLAPLFRHISYYHGIAIGSALVFKPWQADGHPLIGEDS